MERLVVKLLFRLRCRCLGLMFVDLFRPLYGFRVRTVLLACQALPTI